MNVIHVDFKTGKHEPLADRLARITAAVETIKKLNEKLNDFNSDPDQSN